MVLRVCNAAPASGLEIRSSLLCTNSPFYRSTTAAALKSSLLRYNSTIKYLMAMLALISIVTLYFPFGSNLVLLCHAATDSETGKEDTETGHVDTKVGETLTLTETTASSTSSDQIFELDEDEGFRFSARSSFSSKNSVLFKEGNRDSPQAGNQNEEKRSSEIAGEQNEGGQTQAYRVVATETWTEAEMASHEQNAHNRLPPEDTEAVPNGIQQLASLLLSGGANNDNDVHSVVRIVDRSFFSVIFPGAAEEEQPYAGGALISADPEEEEGDARPLSHAGGPAGATSDASFTLSKGPDGTVVINGGGGLQGMMMGMGMGRAGNRLVINGFDVGAAFAAMAKASASLPVHEITLGDENEADASTFDTSTNAIPQSENEIAPHLNQQLSQQHKHGVAPSDSALFGNEGDGQGEGEGVLLDGLRGLEELLSTSGMTMETEIQFVGPNGELLTAEDVARLSKEGAQIELIDQTVEDFDTADGAGGNQHADVVERITTMIEKHNAKKREGITNAIVGIASDDEDDSSDDSTAPPHGGSDKSTATAETTSIQSKKKRPREERTSKSHNAKRFRNPILAAARKATSQKLAEAHKLQDESEIPFEEYLGALAPESGGTNGGRSDFVKELPLSRALNRYRKKSTHKASSGVSTSSSSRIFTPEKVLSMYETEFESYMQGERHRQRKMAATEGVRAGTKREADRGVPNEKEKCLTRLQRTLRLVTLTSPRQPSDGGHEKLHDESAGGGCSLQPPRLEVINSVPSGFKPLMMRFRKLYQEDLDSEECMTAAATSVIHDLHHDDEIGRLIDEVRVQIEMSLADEKGGDTETQPMHMRMRQVESEETMHLCNHFFALTEETSAIIVVNGRSHSSPRVPGIAAKLIAASKPTAAAMASVAFDPITKPTLNKTNQSDAFVSMASLRRFVVSERYLHACPQVVAPPTDRAYRQFLESALGELHFFASVLVLEMHDEPSSLPVATDKYSTFDAAEASAVAFLRLKQGSSGTQRYESTSYASTSDELSSPWRQNQHHHYRRGGSNKASTLAIANLHDVSVRSDARGLSLNPFEPRDSGRLTLTAAAGVAPQSCVGLTSNIYKESRRRRGTMGHRPPSVVISAAELEQKSLRTYGDGRTQLEERLSLFAQGVGSGEAFARSRRFVRGYDVRGLGVDAHFHMDRHVAIINRWIGDGDLHTQSWVKEIGLPLWGRWANALKGRARGLASDPSSVAHMRTVELISSALSASCVSAGCSLAAVQDYLTTGVGMLREFSRRSTSRKQSSSSSSSSSVSSMLHVSPPVVTVRTNYIDSLAQLLYPFVEIVGEEAEVEFRGGSPPRSQSVMSDTLFFQQSMALAALDGGFYQDDDLRGMLRNAPIADKDNGDEEEEGDDGGIESLHLPRGGGGGEVFDVPNDGDEGDGLNGPAAGTGGYHSAAAADGIERAETLMGSLSLFTEVPFEDEQVLDQSLPPLNDGNPSDAFAELNNDDLNPNPGPSTAHRGSENSKRRLVAAYVRRATAAEEFAATFSKMEELLRIESASSSSSSSAASEAHPISKKQQQHQGQRQQLSLPTEAKTDHLSNWEKRAREERLAYDYVRGSVRYDVVTDAFAGVPLELKSGANGKVANGDGSEEVSKKGTGDAAVRALLSELREASIVPLSAMPGLDGEEGATSSTSIFVTDVGTITSQMLLNAASLYISGEMNHVPKDSDRAMCLAAAALTAMGYEDDQRTVLARVTYGNVHDSHARGKNQNQKRTPLSTKKVGLDRSSVRDFVFYVEKEITGVVDLDEHGNALSDVLGLTTGLYSVHDALVGEALRQPVPNSEDATQQQVAYGERGGPLLAMATEPLDLGIHCRHRDLLRWRRAKGLAEDRAEHRRQEMLRRATVLHKTEGIAPSLIATLVNSEGYVPAANANKDAFESLAEKEKGSLKGGEATQRVIEELQTAGLRGFVFGPEDHVFPGKHGTMGIKELLEAASAHAIIISSNLEIAASMRSPAYESSNHQSSTPPEHDGAEEASLSLPIARALYYSLSCMTLQGYAIEKHASYYALLNASSSLRPFGSASDRHPNQSDSSTTDFDDHMLRSPPPVPTVVGECAPFLASLMVNEAVLSNEALASIVTRIKRTETAVAEMTQADEILNPLFTDGAAGFGKTEGQEEEEAAEDDFVATHVQPQPFINVFEEYEEEKSRDSIPHNQPLSFIDAGEDRHLASFADDHLFIHVPYWNLCMRRAVEEQEAAKKSAGGGEDVRSGNTKGNNNNNNKPSPISQCRRLIAYHLYALAASTADLSPRNMSTRISALGQLIALEDAAHASMVEFHRKRKAHGLSNAQGSSTADLKIAGIGDGSNRPWTGGLPELVPAADAGVMGDPALSMSLSSYIGSDDWIKDELKRSDLNNVDASETIHSLIRLRGAYPLATMHAMAANNPWWMPSSLASMRPNEADGGVEVVLEVGETEAEVPLSCAIPFSYNLSEAIGSSGEASHALHAVKPKTLIRHAATRHETSRVGARLFIAEGNGGDLLATPDFSLLMSRSAWAPTTRALAERKNAIRQELSPTSGQETPPRPSPSPSHVHVPLQLSEQFFMPLSYYHTIAPGAFDPYQALVNHEDGAVEDRRRRGGGKERPANSMHSREQLWHGLSKGNIFDTFLPRSSLRQHDRAPSSDALEDWVFDDESGHIVAAAGNADGEFFFLNFVDDEGKPISFTGDNQKKDNPPQRDYTSSGEWTPPDVESEQHIAISGDDDAAVALSLILTTHGMHAAAGLFSGLATSPSEDIVPAAHSSDPFAPFTLTSLVTAEHQETACRISDSSHRLFAESTRPVDSGGRRGLPDEVGGAGATRVATLAKHFARTRFGEPARRRSLFLLSDYAFVDQKQTRKKEVGTAFEKGSDSQRSGGVIEPSNPNPSASLFSLAASPWLRTVLLPAVVSLTISDTLFLAGLRTVLAIVRGVYLSSRFVWDSIVVRQWLWHTRVPPLGTPDTWAAMLADNHTDLNPNANLMRRFLSSAGVLSKVKPDKFDDSVQSSESEKKRLVREAFTFHLNDYFRSQYSGLLQSVLNEMKTASGNNNDHHHYNITVEFNDLTLWHVIRRVFAPENMLQPGLVMRGGRSSLPYVRLWWSEGELIDPSPAATEAYTRTQQYMYTNGAPSSCKMRDLAVFLRHQPRYTDGGVNASTQHQKAPLDESIHESGSHAAYATEAGTIMSPYLEPIFEVIDTFFNRDPHGFVPLLSGGGWLSSIYTAISRVIANVATPLPLCDPFVASHSTSKSASGGTNMASRTAPLSLSSLPPAQRYLANTFLSKTLLLDQYTFTAQPPRTLSTASSSGSRGYGYDVPFALPSPLAPLSERSAALHQLSGQQSVSLFSRKSVDDGHGLGRSSLSSTWFGSYKLVGATLGVRTEFSSHYLGVWQHERPSQLGEKGRIEPDYALLDVLRVNTDPRVVRGDVHNEWFFTRFVFSTWSTVAGLLNFVLFSETFFWGMINQEVYAWRWGAPISLSLQPAHMYEGLAVPFGSDTIPTNKPISLARWWVGSGKSVVDSDAQDTPLYWPRAASQSASSRAGGVSLAEALWESSSADPSTPIADFVLHRYLPVVEARAGRLTTTLTRYSKTNQEAATAVESNESLSVLGSHEDRSTHSLFSRLLAVERVASLLTSGGPEEAAAFAYSTDATTHDPATESRSYEVDQVVRGEGTSALPSPVFANLLERDMWLHLGQYDVVSSLPSRDMMEAETGSSALFLSERDTSSHSPAHSYYSLSHHYVSVSHSPRDVSLGAAYAAHRFAAGNALRVFDETMSAYLRRHDRLSPAEERFSAELHVENDSSVVVVGGDDYATKTMDHNQNANQRKEKKREKSALFALRMTLITPLTADSKLLANNNGAVINETALAPWARSTFAEAVAAHSVAFRKTEEMREKREGMRARYPAVARGVVARSSSSVPIHIHDVQLHERSLFTRFADTMYSAADKVLSSRSFVRGRMIKRVSEIAASEPKNNWGLSATTRKGDSIGARKKTLQWAHIAASVVLPSNTSKESVLSRKHASVSEFLSNISANWPSLLHNHVSEPNLHPQQAVTLGGGSERSVDAGRFSIRVVDDPSLALALSALRDAFAHYWSCSGLGTGMLYTSSTFSGDLFGERARKEGIFAIDERSSTIHTGGDKVVSYWSLDKFSAELQRYVSTVTMRRPSSYVEDGTILSTVARQLAEDASLRNPFADANYLLGDGQCIADMTWILENMGIGDSSENGAPLFDHIEGHFASSKPSSKGDAKRKTCNRGRQTVSTRTSSVFSRSSLLIAVTYEARDALPSYTRPLGKSATAPTHSPIVWHVSQIRLANGDELIEGEDDQESECSSGEPSDAEKTRSQSVIAAIPATLSSLSLAVLRSKQRYEGTARYITPLHSGESTQGGSSNNIVSDALSEDGGEFAPDADAKATIKVGEAPFIGHVHPSHGLYAEGVLHRPRPLFLDAAALSKGEEDAENNALLRLPDTSDPTIVRYRSNTAGDQYENEGGDLTVFPPYSAGFALTSPEDATEAGQSGANSRAKRLPFLVSDADEQIDMRPAPSSWPPRLGEGRSFFGYGSVLAKQTTDGLVHAAEWMSWFKAWSLSLISW